VSEAPAFTILSDVPRPNGARALHVRLQGGSTVRVFVSPLAIALGLTDEAVRAAIASVPPAPGPDS
jgi:hypothetical protein